MEGVEVKGVEWFKFLELDSSSNAVETFVEKAETKASPNYVDGNLERQQKGTLEKQRRDVKLLTEDQVRECCERISYCAAVRVFCHS